MVPAAVMSSGNSLGLVAADGAHGAEGVHRLRAGDARHQLHGKRRNLVIGQGLDARGIRVGSQETDQSGALFEGVDLLHGRRLNLEQDVSCECIGLQARTPLAIGGVREAGRHARAGLDDNLQPCLDELGDQVGNERHTAFSGGHLCGDADDHACRGVEGISDW
jgi:hypothetical protein